MADAHRLEALFHDAVLERVRHEVRDVVLTIDPRPALVPRERRVAVRVVGTSSLCVSRWVAPPLPCPPHRHLPRREQSATVEAWQATGCTRSVGWELVAGALGNPGVELVITSVEELSGDARGHVGLRVGGHLQPEDHWHELELRGERVAFRVGDADVGVEELLALADRGDARD